MVGGTCRGAAVFSLYFQRRPAQLDQTNFFSEDNQRHLERTLYQHERCAQITDRPLTVRFAAELAAGSSFAVRATDYAKGRVDVLNSNPPSIDDGPD